MSDQLPSPDFDSQNYQRPNQKWICGHSAEGQPCRAGPDARGRCGAASECSPALETKPGEKKGRWRCTRPGGPCENGPGPDGSCGRPVAKCSPVQTLRTRRGRLTMAVVIATVAFVLIVMGTPRLRMQFINPGELSSPHTSDAFVRLHSRTNHSEQNCSACHTAGAAGPSDLITRAFHASPGPLEFAKLTKGEPGEMTRIDEACQRCHTTHLAHQPTVVRELSCSKCHKEHQGSGRMALQTEANCTFCHGDATTMAAASDKGKHLRKEAFKSGAVAGENVFASPRPIEGFTRVIHHFAGDHPEFRIHTEKTRDPNTLKFGHALHLTGQTIPNLPNGQKLNCAFCHQPDSAGVYVRSANFESQCRVCHALQFDPETSGLTLPHGDPKFVSAFLHSLPKQYADYAARTGVTEAGQQKDFVQQKLQKLQASMVSGEDLQQRVFFSTSIAGPPTQVGSVSGATRALYPGCVYCHEVKPGVQGLPEVTKPVTLNRWLTHGTFNHAKHDKLACNQCHQAAQSKVTADVILPTKANCVTCHSKSGGVADACTTCHAYHR